MDGVCGAKFQAPAGGRHKSFHFEHIDLINVDLTWNTIPGKSVKDIYSLFDLKRFTSQFKSKPVSLLLKFP